MSNKLAWETLRKRKGTWLRAEYSSVEENNNAHELLKEIAAWCLDNDCGRRLSYDSFKFENKEQATAFLLRWS